MKNLPMPRNELAKLLGLQEKDLKAIARMNKEVQSDVELIVARVGTLYADKELKDQSTARVKYQDAAGKFGNSAAGFMIQVNKRIKAKLNKEVGVISNKLELDIIKTIRLAIAKKIIDMIANEDSHSDIKESCYKLIGDVCDIYGLSE